jgi:hypothetical protein
VARTVIDPLAVGNDLEVIERVGVLLDEGGKDGIEKEADAQFRGVGDLEFSLAGRCSRTSV